MRAAKNNTMKEIVIVYDNASDVEDIFKNTSKDNSKTCSVPIVCQNAPSRLSLDLFKHFKRRSLGCTIRL